MTVTQFRSRRHFNEWKNREGRVASVVTPDIVFESKLNISESISIRTAIFKRVGMEDCLEIDSVRQSDFEVGRHERVSVISSILPPIEETGFDGVGAGINGKCAFGDIGTVW